jgi:hypothetical protein
VKRGGKLILSGGWNNALVPAGAVLDYYGRVQTTIGAENTRRGLADVRAKLGGPGASGRAAEAVLEIAEGKSRGV